MYNRVHFCTPICMIKNSQQLKKTRWGNNNSFKRRLKYNLKQEKLFKLRKWLYSTLPIHQLTKADYIEAGSLVYSPSYLSFESILQDAGIVFQYDSEPSFAGPRTTQIVIWSQEVLYRRLPFALLTNPVGIVQKDGLAQATPERAICDTLYRNKHYPFDRIPKDLNKKLLKQLVTIYSEIRWQKELPKIVLSLLSTHERSKDES